MKTVQQTRLDGGALSPLTEAGVNLVNSIIAGAKGATSWVANELATRRAIAELQSLDDRMLKDIGVSRASIEAIIRSKIDDTYPR